jgi:hypothetical protein
MNSAKILRPQWRNFIMVLRITKPRNRWRTWLMTLGEFSQHDDKYYREFEYGKPLVLKHVHLKLPWTMQKFYEWYYLTCVYGLNFVEAKIPGDIFITLDFDLNVKLVELHTIYYLQMLDITMMIIWCM